MTDKNGENIKAASKDRHNGFMREILTYDWLSNRTYWNQQKLEDRMIS